MQWIELFINFVRGSTATNLDPESSSTNQHPAFSSPDGTSAQQGKKSKRRGISAVDLEVCLPAGGTQRQEALAEIDALVVHAYRLKYQREIKLRKRVVRREVEGAGNKAESSTRQVGGKNTESWNEDDDAQFVRAAVENLGVGDVFSGEVEEADEDSSAEEEEEEDEDEEFFDPNQEPGTTPNSSKLSTGRSIGHRRLASGEDEDASWRPPPKEDKDLPPIPTPNRSDSTFINAGTSTGDERQDKIDRERKRKGKAPAPRLPPLKHIPEMVPLFVEMVSFSFSSEYMFHGTFTEEAMTQVMVADSRFVASLHSTASTSPSTSKNCFRFFNYHTCRRCYSFPSTSSASSSSSRRLVVVLSLFLLSIITHTSRF